MIQPGELFIVPTLAGHTIWDRKTKTFEDRYHQHPRVTFCYSRVVEVDESEGVVWHQELTIDGDPIGSVRGIDIGLF